MCVSAFSRVFSFPFPTTLVYVVHYVTAATYYQYCVTEPVNILIIFSTRQYIYYIYTDEINGDGIINERCLRTATTGPCDRVHKTPPPKTVNGSAKSAAHDYRRPNISCSETATHNYIDVCVHYPRQ